MQEIHISTGSHLVVILTMLSKNVYMNIMQDNNTHLLGHLNYPVVDNVSSDYSPHFLSMIANT